MPRTPRSARYLAFLRGINLGKRRISMPELRDHFAALGLANVETFIASGNVIFETTAGDASALEAKIEAHLKSSLGYEVDTFLRTPAELAEVVAFRPFAPADLDAPGHTFHVGFLRAAPGDEIARTMAAMQTTMDEFRIQGRELYWLCRGKTTDSLVSWPQVAKAAPMSSTMRNITTVRKLAAKYPPG